MTTVCRCACAGVMVNITATKEAELRVRASEARLTALVEHAADMVAIVNADMTVRWVSPAVEQVLGVHPDDVVGTSALAWMHPDDLAYTTAQFQRVAQEPGRVDLLTYRVHHQQGETHWVETTVINLLHDPAISGAIVCNARDITGWVLAREEREHRERQLRAVIESSYEIISRFDRELRHVFVNQAAAQFVGLEAAHLLGMRIDELGAPSEETQRFAAALREVFATGEAMRIEVEHDTPTGMMVFSCHLLPKRTIDGEIETVLAISRDVTEDRRHADALQHQVFHDHLTGLPNRVLLSERMDGQPRGGLQ